MIAAVKKRFDPPKDKSQSQSQSKRPPVKPAPFSGSYSDADQHELSKADSEAFRMAGVGSEARDDLRRRVVGQQ